MAIKSGLLGTANLAGNVEANPYTCVAPAVAVTCTVNFCNKNSKPAKVRLAIGTGADSTAPGTVFLEFDAQITGTEVLERGGIALSPGCKLFVKSDQDSVDVAVYGYEKG